MKRHLLGSMWKYLGKCKCCIKEQIPQIIHNFYPFIKSSYSLMLCFCKSKLCLQWQLVKSSAVCDRHLDLMELLHEAVGDRGQLSARPALPSAHVAWSLRSHALSSSIWGTVFQKALLAPYVCLQIFSFLFLTPLKEDEITKITFAPEWSLYVA